MIKTVLKRILHLVFADYQLNRIYKRDPTALPPESTQGSTGDAKVRRLESARSLLASDDPRMRDHAWYVDDKAQAYGVFEGEELACFCCFWPAGHAKLPSRFEHLTESGAVMVDLLTTPRARGKGYAAWITRHAEQDLLRRGYTSLWTWVWHSNTPSIRVFEKAGWEYAYFLAEFRLRGMQDYLRMKRRPR